MERHYNHFSQIPVSVPVRTNPPTWEPVTLQQAKHQVGVPDASNIHDDRMHRLIEAARILVESDTSYIFAAGEFTWTIPWFPKGSYPLTLPIHNVTSVTSVSADGVALDPSEYEFVDASVWPALTPTDVWPTGECEVVFAAGYTLPGDVPADMAEEVLIMLQSNWDPDNWEKVDAIYQSKLIRKKPFYVSPPTP